MYYLLVVFLIKDILNLVYLNDYYKYIIFCCFFILCVLVESSINFYKIKYINVMQSYLYVYIS